MRLRAANPDAVSVGTRRPHLAPSLRTALDVPTVDAEHRNVVTVDRARSRLRTIAAGRCPRCRTGAVFAGWLTMHERCPSCGLRFEREPGYFLGAMYVSYALSVPLLTVAVLVVWWSRPTWTWLPVLAVATALYLPLVPWVFRASRVLWIHLDRTIDPE